MAAQGRGHATQHEFSERPTGRPATQHAFSERLAETGCGGTREGDRLTLRQINLGFVLSGLSLLSGGCFTALPSTDKDGVAARAAACETPEDVNRLADQVLQLVNLERAAADLPPVSPSDQLEKVAGDFACTMIRDGFFGHRDPVSNKGPAARAIAGRYSFEAVGENLAAGQDTPAEVVRVWMESPRHRAIILDPKWTDIGVAVRFGGEYGVYWVQEFGQPAAAK